MVDRCVVLVQAVRASVAHVKDVLRIERMETVRVFQTLLLLLEPLEPLEPRQPRQLNLQLNLNVKLAVEKNIIATAPSFISVTIKTTGSYNIVMAVYISVPQRWNARNQTKPNV